MMSTRACTGGAVTLMVCMLPAQGAAQPAHATPVADAHAAIHRHHAGIFAGATTNLSADHTDPTLGIEYEYRLPVWHDRVGLAPFAEFTFAEHEEWILGGGAVLYPAHGLKLFAGGGLLFADESAGDHHGADPHVSAGGASESPHPLLRLGAGWQFHAGRISLTPSVFYDRVKGHGSLVYGLTVGTALTRRKSGEAGH